jgi:hypothetical protein
MSTPDGGAPVEIALPRVAGYGDDGVSDFGWGCVYRNVQTLRAYWDMSFMGLDTMRARLRLPRTASSNRAMWIEPPDVRRGRLLPPGRLVLFVPGGDYGAFLSKSPRGAVAGQFDVRTADKTEWWRFVADSLAKRKSPIVLDDQVSSYVLYGFDKNHLYLADPHFSDPSQRVRKVPLGQLFAKPWMAYAV